MAAALFGIVGVLTGLFLLEDARVGVKTDGLQLGEALLA